MAPSSVRIIVVLSFFACCIIIFMDHRQFKALQEQLGWSGTRLATELGVKPLSVTRWRNGANIPGPVSLAMQALASGWRS